MLNQLNNFITNSFFGYFIYGYLSEFCFFLGGIYLKINTKIDYSYGILVRGIATFICSYLISAIDNVDINLKGD